MVSNRRDVFDAALALPDVDRTELIERLLDSLDPAHREQIDAAWAEEAERRLAALERGDVKAVAGEAVLRSLSRGQRP